MQIASQVKGALMWLHDLAVHNVKLLIPSYMYIKGKNQLSKNEFGELRRLAIACVWVHVEQFIRQLRKEV